jgi:hypothetical protein
VSRGLGIGNIDTMRPSTDAFDGHPSWTTFMTTRSITHKMDALSGKKQLNGVIQTFATVNAGSVLLIGVVVTRKRSIFLIDQGLGGSRGLPRTERPNTHTWRNIQRSPTE